MIRRLLASTAALAALIAALLIAQAPAAGQAESPATKAAQQRRHPREGRGHRRVRPMASPTCKGVWQRDADSSGKAQRSGRQGIFTRNRNSPN